MSVITENCDIDFFFFPSFVSNFVPSISFLPIEPISFFNASLKNNWKKFCVSVETLFSL